MPTPPVPSVTVLQHPIAGNAVLRYVERPDKYQHTIGAWLGYDKAKFGLETTRSDLNFWFDAVGKKVEVHSPSMTKIWEGFIDEVKIDVGPLTYKIGPLMDVGNMLLLIFSPTVNYWRWPTGTLGRNVQGTVPTTNAQRSQDKYGIIWQALNLGAATWSGTEAAHRTFYDKRLFPRTTWDVKSGGGSSPSVSVDCLGYVHWLNWYADVWDEFWGVGSESATAHLSRILANNPNSAWLAIDETYMDTNAQFVPVAVPRDMTALEQIKDTIVWGSGPPNYDRWLFGMYNDYEIHYHAAPTDIEYELHLEDDRFALQAAKGVTESRIWPWDVRPGKWVMLADFLPGLTLPDWYPEDPRLGFIEEVVYTAPHGLQLKGADFDLLDRMQEYWGMAGVAV